MPKTFKYDVVKLIEGVRDRPCLWDKTLENYKDRVERRTAWEEIFCLLDDEYEGMTWEEKRITGELILNKWTNVRDTFIKTLKTKMGKPKKKYLFHDQLKFLIKVVPEEECSIEYSTDDVSTYVKQETACDESSGYSTRTRSRKSEYIEEEQLEDDTEDTYVPPRKSKKGTDSAKKAKKQETGAVFESFSYDDTGNDNIDFVEVNESDPRVMNEDEAFFASLLPTVVRYSEDERLEFRLEVLSVMKRIREKKKWPDTIG